jgi:hypothetical protein
MASIFSTEIEEVLNLKLVPTYQTTGEVTTFRRKLMASTFSTEIEEVLNLTYLSNYTTSHPRTS